MRASTPQRRGAAESDGNTSTSSRTTAGANLGDEALRLELERDKLVLVLERDKRMEARAARRVAYLRQRVDATRKRMGGYGALLYRTGPLGSIDVAGKAQRILERERDKLENRLCDTRSRHNKIQRENLDLKEQINGRRRARLSFQGVFSRIQADLQEAKRAIDRDTRLCHQNYAERDRAQLEMASLQQRVAAARRAYDEEWRRLTARLEEQQALATDQWDKAQGDGADRPGAVPHSPTRSAVKRVPKSDTWRSAWLLAKDATIADDSRMRKQDFAAKWERVRAETGAASLEEVLAGFRAAAEEVREVLLPQRARSAPTRRAQRYQHLRVTHQLETEIAALQREVRQMDAEIAHAKRAQSSQQAGDTTAASLQASIKQTQAAVRDSEEQRRSRLLGVAQVLQPLKVRHYASAWAHCRQRTDLPSPSSNYCSTWAPRKSGSWRSAPAALLCVRCTPSWAP